MRPVGGGSVCRYGGRLFDQLCGAPDRQLCHGPTAHSTLPQLGFPLREKSGGQRHGLADPAFEVGHGCADVRPERFERCRNPGIIEVARCALGGVES